MPLQPGDALIGAVDKAGRLRIGLISTTDLEIKWKTIARNIIDLEISSSGLTDWITHLYQSYDEEVKS